MPLKRRLLYLIEQGLCKKREAYEQHIKDLFVAYNRILADLKAINTDPNINFTERTTSLLKSIESFKDEVNKVRNLDFLKGEKKSGKDLKIILDSAMSSYEMAIKSLKIPEKLVAIEKALNSVSSQKGSKQSYTEGEFLKRVKKAIPTTRAKVQKSKDTQDEIYNTCKTLLRIFALTIPLALPFFFLTIPIYYNLEKRVDEIPTEAKRIYESNLTILSNVNDDIEMIERELPHPSLLDSETTQENVETVQEKINSGIDKLKDITNLLATTLGMDIGEKKKISFANE